MKFWKKLVLFITASTSIILSFSRYYIVKNNFETSIENNYKQNNNQYILEKYMLESNIVKSIENGEEFTYDNMLQQLKGIEKYIKDSKVTFALYDQKYEKIYSNITEIEDLNIAKIINKEDDTYSLRKLGQRHYMLFTSKWNINGQNAYIINAYDIEDVYEEQERQLSSILITDIIILAVSTVIITLFSAYLTRPIASLGKISKKIASGEYKERAKIKSDDEIGELAENFNKMAEQIEIKINELNMQVKQKSDFINDFTHELKTPMTAIVGFTDLLRLKKCDTETSKTALNYIYAETKRLENLSYKLMKLMSLTSEKIELKPFDIFELMNKVVKLETIIITKNQIETYLEKAKVIGDIELLEVVLRNLIENANKAEPKDGKIYIVGETVGNKYKISIVDKGKGIPKEHIQRVTEDFYMVDKSRSRENGGSGIGLSLVKKILNLHGTDIEIESEEGIGTIASFVLDCT